MKDRLDDAGLGGWLDDWDIENIYKEVSKLKFGQTYVEIGVAHGASLSIANSATKDGINLYGIDRIDWPDREGLIEKFLGYQGKHEFIEGESEVQARFWNRGEIDLLFIDGDHTYEGVLKDIALWVPWVKHGGIIMFDDYTEVTGVKEAVNKILFEHKAFKDQKVEGEMFIITKI